MGCRGGSDGSSRRLSLLSLSPLEATRNLGRPVVRSVCRSVALARQAKAWQAQTFTAIKNKRQFRYCHPVTPSLCHVLSSHPMQPANNLSQEFLNPLLLLLDRNQPSFPLQPSQRRLHLFRLFRRFRLK
jgi:hypothetical protein